VTRPLPTVPLLLTRLLPAEYDALVGDVFEEYQAGRSRVWLWRQVLWALLALLLFWRLTERGVSTIQDAAVQLAVLVVIAFEVVVAATLLDQAFALASFAWAVHLAGQQGVLWVCAVSFPMALTVARLLPAITRARRAAVALGCGASAVLVAFVTLQLVHPTAPRPFLPSAGAQLLAATVFVCGLVAGLGVGSSRGGTRMRRTISTPR
jgi:hypothetical protein